MAKGRSLISPAFGQAVRELRIKAGLSQERLGELSGLHRTYIGDVERGLKSPSLKAVEALARALGRKPHELIVRAEQLSGWR